MEVMVVIGLFVIVAGMTFYFFSGFNKKEILEKDVAGVSALVRDARMLSVTSKDSSVFGIHFEADKVILFKGGSYITGGSDQKIFTLSKTVYMSEYSLDLGIPDVVFARFSGETSNFGTVTFSLDDDSASTTITISRTGVVQ